MQKLYLSSYLTLDHSWEVFSWLNSQPGTTRYYKSTRNSWHRDNVQVDASALSSTANSFQRTEEMKGGGINKNNKIKRLKAFAAVRKKSHSGTWNSLFSTKLYWKTSQATKVARPRPGPILQAELRCEILGKSKLVSPHRSPKIDNNWGVNQQQNPTATKSNHQSKQENDFYKVFSFETIYFSIAQLIDSLLSTLLVVNCTDGWEVSCKSRWVGI